MTTAMQQIQQLRQELAKLSKSAARRSKQAIADATSEILQLQLHTDLARIVAADLLIGGAR